MNKGIQERIDAIEAQRRELAEVDAELFKLRQRRNKLIGEIMRARHELREALNARRRRGGSE